MALIGSFDTGEVGRIGAEIFEFAAELYPICRSITGDGLRRTLSAVQRLIPLQIHEIPSGTTAFDWTVPKEWNIRAAYIKGPRGHKVVDFENCNLHVLNYSQAWKATMSLNELRPHLFSIPEKPEWIPYRTSYYKENWGFCISHNQLMSLEEGEYEVYIDSSLEDGSLTYGECYIPGSSADEILISCHSCHPSLANDNLSGIAVAAFLAKFLLDGRNPRLSYRFLFAPGTIGAICWLASNRDTVCRIRHGLVLTCIGDSGGFHYKKSRRGDAEIDRAAAHVLRHFGEPHEVLEFSPYGYDERQYCSPGFNLPVGCLMRSVWGEFPEYHTSADNLDFIRPVQLGRSFQLCAGIFDVLDGNIRYRSNTPYCEPQLGKHNLYRPTGGAGIGAENMALLWVLNQADGQNTLLDIAERSGMPYIQLDRAAELLLKQSLLSVVPE